MEPNDVPEMVKCAICSKEKDKCNTSVIWITRRKKQSLGRELTSEGVQENMEIEVLACYCSIECYNKDGKDESS